MIADGSRLAPTLQQSPADTMARTIRNHSQRRLAGGLRAAQRELESHQMTYTIDPSDLTPGNYVKATDGDVGIILPDLDCLHPAPPDIDRPEEWIAVSWESGVRTATHLSQLVYAGQRRPE